MYSNSVPLQSVGRPNALKSNTHSYEATNRRTNERHCGSASSKRSNRRDAGPHGHLPDPSFGRVTHRKIRPTSSPRKTFSHRPSYELGMIHASSNDVLRTSHVRQRRLKIPIGLPSANVKTDVYSTCTKRQQKATSDMQPTQSVAPQVPESQRQALYQSRNRIEFCKGHLSKIKGDLKLAETNMTKHKRAIERLEHAIGPRSIMALDQRRSHAEHIQMVERGAMAKVQPLDILEKECDDGEGHFIIRPGALFAFKFRIAGLLGQGTFGKVIECMDLERNVPVAIKIIRNIRKYREASITEIKVLKTIQMADRHNHFGCIHLKRYFDYRNHVCMVFDLLGKSIFDYLKDNNYQPYTLYHIQKISVQVIKAVSFLHDLGLVHTDLKPENILFTDSSSDTAIHRIKKYEFQVPLNEGIQLIDFGSTVFLDKCDETRRLEIVSTRHYRAPEVILGIPWSYSCDLWSIGCILIELLTGEPLFQTHDNLEHLAIMEKTIGGFPRNYMAKISADKRKEYFDGDGKVLFPNSQTDFSSQQFVSSRLGLEATIGPHDEPRKLFHDLIRSLLIYDPHDRITAREALAHPFLSVPISPDDEIYRFRIPKNEAEKAQLSFKSEGISSPFTMPKIMNHKVASVWNN